MLCILPLTSQTTAWDRITGGTAILVHIDGTLEPDAPVSPQYVKAHVYLNPGLLDDIPEITPAVARIVQLFIEDIGLPVIRRWFRAFKKEGFSLTKCSTRVIRIPSSIPLIPKPVPRGSTHHVFRGHATGVLDTRLVGLSAVTGGIHSEVALADDAEFRELQARLDQMSVEYTEKVEVLEEALHLETSEHHDLVAILNYKIDHLKDTLADRDGLIQELRSALRQYGMCLFLSISRSHCVDGTVLAHPTMTSLQSAPLAHSNGKSIFL